MGTALGEGSECMRLRIQDQIVRMLTNTMGTVQHPLQCASTVQALSRLSCTDLRRHCESTKQAAEEIIREKTQITRDVFNIWLRDPDMLAMLEDVEIDISAKFDIFDVLDSDMSKELSFDETIEGLMRLRGPVTKGDI